MKLATMLLCFLLGCVGDRDDYRAELEALPSVEVTHGAEAVALVARAMGVDASLISVTWVVGGMHRPSGEPIAGAAIGCDLWIEWWGERWTSGASADGPAISFTALAHEIAHCALWFGGDEDPEHSRAGWWGGGGMVEMAGVALVQLGL